MPPLYLDTHVLVWLYAETGARLTEAGRNAMETHDLLISPMVGLELGLLNEIGRLRVPAVEVIEALREPLGLEYCDLPFITVTERAHSLVWTRDPFDRLIVAQALSRGARLLTADRHIQSHFSGAFW